MSETIRKMREEVLRELLIASLTRNGLGKAQDDAARELGYVDLNAFNRQEILKK